MNPEPIFLRHPELSDVGELVELARDSRELHHPWVYPSEDPREVTEYVKRGTSDRFTALLVCLQASRAIVGVCNLSEIVRGHFHNAYLGFYGRAGYERRGYMSEGVRAAVEWAFTREGLHRVEANVQPGNKRSRAVVERCGFRLEGFSPRYLQVGGAWRDHERWAITLEDWVGSARP